MDMMMWLAGDDKLNDYDEYVAFPPPLECVLNVAGSRESHAPGIQEAVYNMMVDVVRKVNITSTPHALRCFEGFGDDPDEV